MPRHILFGTLLVATLCVGTWSCGTAVKSTEPKHSVAPSSDVAAAVQVRPMGVVGLLSAYYRAAPLGGGWSIGQVIEANGGAEVTVIAPEPAFRHQSFHTSAASLACPAASDPAWQSLPADSDITLLLKVDPEHAQSLRLSCRQAIASALL